MLLLEVQRAHLRAGARMDLGLPRSTWAVEALRFNYAAKDLVESRLR